MSNISFLIKPASCKCNINCSYCFYNDLVRQRKVVDYGIMETKTMKSLITKALNNSYKSVNFIFQGGEPTIAGIEYFKMFIELVNQYNKNNIQINYSIQTNGLLVTDEFLKLFKENNFLVGLSLDGPKNIHDFNRFDFKKRGTFERVMDTTQKLQEENIRFNILSVVTKKHCDNVTEVYKFMKDNQFKYLQFIPCLENLDQSQKHKWSLTNKSYAAFLDELFNHWYGDLRINQAPSIRYFDNLYGIINNFEPESCDMRGICSIQMVVESDGSVFPCDFYATDSYYLGNINTDELEQIMNNEKIKKFIENSLKLPEKCQKCKYYKLCRGGCFRNRNQNGINQLCEAYKIFFNSNVEKLETLKR